MNGRLYAQQRLQHLKLVLDAAGIHEYKSVILSADQTEYEIVFDDGTTQVIPSGLDYFED